MSVTPNQIVFYGSADMPTVDGTATGGSVAFTTRIGFSDIQATGTMDYVSDSASDTATTITLAGRDGSGTIQSETKTLTGTTPVSGSQSFQRLLSGQVSGTVAVGDVAAISNTPIVTGTAQGAQNTSGTVGPYLTLQAGQGASGAVNNILRITNNTPVGVEFQLRRVVSVSGDTAYVDRDWATLPTSSTTYALHTGMLFEVSPNQVTEIIRIFYNCQAQQAGGSNLTFYAKAFMVNNNTLTSAQPSSPYAGVNLQIVSASPALPGSVTLNVGLASGLNDPQSGATRQTFPSGISFTSGALPVSASMTANGGVLPAGAAPNAAGSQGVWFELYLPAGASPYDGFAALESFFATT